MKGLAPHCRFVGIFAFLLALAACDAVTPQERDDASAEGRGSGGAFDASPSSDLSNDAVSDAGTADGTGDVAEIIDAQHDSATSPDGSADAEGSDAAEEDTTPPEPIGPWMEIGQGESAFEGVNESSAVACVFGPQGSYHVWAAIRLHNIEPSAVLVDTTAEIGGTAVGAGFAAPLNSEWTINPDGTADIFGQFLYLDFGIDFPALSDLPVTLRATARSDSVNMVVATATGRFLCIQ
jgi:hypothetical protein